MSPLQSHRLRIAILAPHFAEYSRRLAGSLATNADVLLITERRNDEAECGSISRLLGNQKVVCDAFRSADVLDPLSLRGLQQRRRIRRAIEAFRPHILHIQEQGDAFTAALCRKLGTRMPIVLTVHDPSPHTGADTHVARRFARGLATLRASAQGFHVHGAWCAGELHRKIGPSRPILATQHGVLLTPPHPRPVAADAPFLFFGRMELYKGFETLLAAIEARPNGRGRRVIFAGRGPELQRHADRIARLPIEVIDRHLPPTEAIELFQRAAALLIPYDNATQSGVISAAYGNGRPVIATRVGGLPDSVTDGVSGLLIPPGDPQALAGAMSALDDPDTLARLAAGAAAEAETRFSWEAIAADLMGFYRRLLRP